MNSDNPKILILCNDFPPINSIGSDRPYSWFKYFYKFGIEPIVITKNWETNGNDRRPLIKNTHSHLKTEFGEIIKTKTSHTISSKFQEVFGNKFLLLRQIITFIEMTLGFYIRKFDRHRSIYYEARKYIEKNEIDLVITTGEPFILFLYGHKLHKEFGVKWISDYRDGWYLNHKFGIQMINRDIANQKPSIIERLKENIIEKFTRKWEFFIEKKVSKTSSTIVTVDPELAGRLQLLLKKKVDVIYNGFWNYYDVKAPRSNTFKVVFNHTGTLAPGQELELFLDSILELFLDNKINETNFEFNLIGLEYFPDRMKRLLNYKPILNRLVFTTPRLSKDEATQRNLNADYLVNFTDPNLSAIYAKTYDYIACRKPIIVIPGDRKLLDNLVSENNLGYILSSKEKIKDFILSPVKPKFPQYDNMQKFTRERQAENFTILIKKILNTS